MVARTTSTSSTSSTASTASSPDTATQPAPEADQPRAFLGLTFAQLVAGAAAAVTAAFAASRVGVGGTLMGAAFGSVISSVAAAAYGHSLTTAGKRLRGTSVTVRVVPQAALQRPSDLPVLADGPVVDDAAPGARRAFGWRAGVALAVSAFVLAVGLITVFELGIGRTVSGDSGSGQGGTSIGQVLGGSTQTEESSEPTTTPTGTPSGTESATSSPTESAETEGADATQEPAQTATQGESTPTQTSSPTTTPTSEPTTGETTPAP
jgi:hypothetical protein